MSRKLALIIGNSEYDDTGLARLKSPGLDAHDLAGALGAPEIGAFDDVITLINEAESNVRRAIARFFVNKKPDDLLLLYFSGHGVRDDQGQLYLAVKDTDRALLSATAMPAAFITHQMDASRSRRQVLILDCCNSGAFDRATKSGGAGSSMGTATAFEGVGYGRVVLTASDSTQYAWEGDQVIGEADNSVFTRYLVQGLETGEADFDNDGQISLDEWYDYVYAHVVNDTPRQTPGKWSYKQQGDLIVAKNPKPRAPKSVELPPELRQAVESPFMGVREGAVRDLGSLLMGSNPGLALAARAALQKLAEDDSRRVSTAALEVLNTQTEAQHAQEKERQERERLAAQQAQADRQAREAKRAEAERIARERAEAERIARQKAEEEQRVRERAEQERIAQAERLAREQVDRERLAREAPDWQVENIKAEQPAAGKTEPERTLSDSLLARPVDLPGRIASFVQTMWFPLLLTILGWGAGWYFGETIQTAILGDEKSLELGYIAEVTSWVIAGALGGLLTSLALRTAEPALGRTEQVLITGSWILGGAIGWGIYTAVQYLTGDADRDLTYRLGYVVFGAMGGFGTGYRLTKVRPSVRWGQGLLMVIAWAVAAPIAIALFTEPNPPLQGALVGAIGGGVMFWQLVREQ